MSSRYVTISVDDGYPLDSRVAELLVKYGLQATFYIPASNPERPVMPDSQIRDLAQQFEIGGHTYNHAGLKALPEEKAFAEIYDGKKWLEDLLSQPVISFCYPQGKFNSLTPRLVQKAGFLGARTCLFNLHSFPRDPFLWGLSTHACYHSRLIQLRHAALEGNVAGMVNFLRTYHGTTDWQQHFFYALEHVERHGGIAHLYLHSWEIDQLGQWAELEAVLAETSRSDFAKVTNGALFKLWTTRNGNGKN
jgi:peptidoglycan-N-acetylglucosamine deacetylase